MKYFLQMDAGKKHSYATYSFTAVLVSHNCLDTCHRAGLPGTASRVCVLSGGSLLLATACDRLLLEDAIDRAHL